MENSKKMKTKESENEKKTILSFIADILKALIGVVDIISDSK